MKRNVSLPDLNDVADSLPCSIATDINPERLPKNSPYVGTFHWGYRSPSASKLNLDINPERLRRDCPYIGNFHRGHKVSLSQSQDICDLDRNALNKSWKKFIDGSHLPKSPELCGLQAILPRQCGVRIVDKLGEGSFGKVVLALNKRNKTCWTDESFLRKLTSVPGEGENLVLKCVRKEYSGGSHSLICVAREVALHSRCFHPNISRMHGYYESGQYVTMILDYIEGQELFEILRIRRSLPEEEACSMALQVLRAVDYIHGKFIIHRDLTPHNVMMKKSGHVLVIDFGLAVELGSCPVESKDFKSSPVGVAGTMGYIAPEIMRREQMTTAVDIWSVGVIVYEAMFGFPPFAPHEVIGNSVVEFPDPSWTPSSTEVQDLVGKMLCKTPLGRCSASKALSHAWFTDSVKELADSLSGTVAPETEEPFPLWLDGGLSQSHSSHSLSSESECEISSCPSTPAPPAAKFPVIPEHEGGSASRGRASTNAGPLLGADEEDAGPPPAGGRDPEESAGRRRRRECVLELDAQLGVAEGEEGEERGGVFRARLVEVTDARSRA